MPTVRPALSSRANQQAGDADDAMGRWLAVGAKALITPAMTLTVLVMAGAMLGACGSSPKRDFVSSAEQRVLPTRQLSAGTELCPDRDLLQRDRLSIKRRAHRHVEALIRSFRRHPDALVRTTYASSDEGPGKADLTVRKLLEQWVKLSYCAPNVQKQLRAALTAPPA